MDAGRRQRVVRDARRASTVPTDREVSLTGSHIRPQPGYGYDERRHVTVWGRATAVGADGAVTFEGRPTAWGWDEAEMPFFEYSERSRRRSRASTSTRCRRSAGRRSSPGCRSPFLALRATRLPFLTATIIPVVAGHRDRRVPRPRSTC